jgi:GAF domain-containing protein
MRGIQAVGVVQCRACTIEEMYRFADQLSRAETPNDVYEAGLDIIEGALGCRRACILLLDDADVVRFVAGRGLSDAARRAFEGHLPWTRDVKDPRPICIEEVETTDLPEPLNEVMRAEQIGALVFIPLVASGRLMARTWRVMMPAKCSAPRT